MEKINIGFFLNLIEKIRREYKEDEIKIFPAGYNESTLYKVYKMFPKKIKENILIPLYHAKKQKKSDYCYSLGYRKIMALDFLEYIFKKKPNFDLTIFSKPDQENILKFLQNIFYFALLDKIKKDRLFNKKDLEIIRRYHVLANNIRKKSNNYEFKHNGKKYIFPIQNLEIPIFFHNYNLNELPEEIIKKLQGKDFIDVGAYIGDSALVLNNFYPRKLYAFEPIPENFQNLLKTINLNQLKNIVPIQKGLGDNNARLKLVKKDIISFIDESGSEEVEIIKLDDFVKENSIQTGLIKLDVEGYELEVLKGAKETIKKFKPLLIVSVYHTGKDFFEIPLLLKKLGYDKFRFFDFNHEFPANDKVLMAYKG